MVPRALCSPGEFNMTIFKKQEAKAYFPVKFQG